MKTVGAGKLVTIYVDSTDQWHGRPLYSAIEQACKDQGLAGATVFRGAEGYGTSGHLHTSRLLELSSDLPVRIEVVDVPERIEPLLAVLEPMISEGLVTITDVYMQRYRADRKK